MQPLSYGTGDQTSSGVPPHPLPFRRKQVLQVMQCVRAIDSCAIVGVSSTGKGNLLRFLARADVRQHYLGADGARTLFVYLDCNRLGKVSDGYVYELCLRGLLDALGNEASHVEGAKPQIDKLHKQALGSDSPLEAQLALEEAVKLLAGGLNLKLVFEFDEFDVLVEHLDYGCFLALRALRDDWKQNLCYLVAMRHDPAIVAGDLWKKAESFFELFTPNMLPLPPYGYEDAASMLYRLAHRYGVTLSRKAVRQIVDVTGGHAGLLAVAFRLGFVQGRLEDQGFFGPLLLEEGLIADECDKIWDSLDADERAVLMQVVRRQVPVMSRDDVVVEDLVSKGMLVRRRADSDLPEVFSTLFETYIRKHKLGLR